MDLFGPNGCPGLERTKAAAIEEFADGLITCALATPRHPRALMALALEIDHRTRRGIEDIMGWRIDFDLDATPPPGSGSCCIAIGDHALGEVLYGNFTIAIGNHAGFRSAGSRCILLGDNTQTT